MVPIFGPLLFDAKQAQVVISRLFAIPASAKPLPATRSAAPAMAADAVRAVPAKQCPTVKPGAAYWRSAVYFFSGAFLSAGAVTDFIGGTCAPLLSTVRQSAGS
jgi:hypothetical protein